MPPSSRKKKKQSTAIPKAVEMLEGADQHWYREVGTDMWLPSVSTVLGALKDGLEYVSPYDLKKAQERGIKVHKATELLEEGQTLEKIFYSAQEWDMLGGFINWHRETLPHHCEKSEHKMANTKLGYAGTLDRIYDIKEKIILVDIKTTSSIYDKAWLQCAAYGALAEKEGHKVDHTAILRLTDRSAAKYQYVECCSKSHPTHWRDDLKVFNHHLATYQYLYGGSQPKESDLPDTMSL